VIRERGAFQMSEMRAPEEGKIVVMGAPVLRFKRRSLLSRKRPVGGLTWAGV